MNTSFVPLFRLLCNVGYQPAKVYFIYQRYFATFNFIHINKCGGTSVEHALRIPVKIHETAQERRKSLGAKYEEMFTFALVRHPYNRVQSLYQYRCKTDQNNMADGHIGLNDWIRAAFRDRDNQYYDNPRMFRPCHDWLVDSNGKNIVSHVAKIEDIDREWPKICGEIGVNARLEKHNSSTSDDEQAALDVRSRAIIDEVFKRDFEVYGYS